MPVRGGWAATGVGGKLRIGWTFGLDLFSAYSTPPCHNAIDRNCYGLNVSQVAESSRGNRGLPCSGVLGYGG